MFGISAGRVCWASGTQLKDKHQAFEFPQFVHQTSWCVGHTPTFFSHKISRRSKRRLCLLNPSWCKTVREVMALQCESFLMIPRANASFDTCSCGHLPVSLGRVGTAEPVLQVGPCYTSPSAPGCCSYSFQLVPASKLVALSHLFSNPRSFLPINKTKAIISVKPSGSVRDIFFCWQGNSEIRTCVNQFFFVFFSFILPEPFPFFRLDVRMWVALVYPDMRSSSRQSFISCRFCFLFLKKAERDEVGVALWSHVSVVVVMEDPPSPRLAG